MHPPPLNSPMKTAICCSFLREAGIFSSLKRKKGRHLLSKKKAKGLFPPPPPLLFPKSPFQPGLNESSAHRHWALARWGPTGHPEGKGGENRANRGPTGVECVYSTSFSRATTLLIAEKKMTSPVWRGASAAAHCHGGLPVPTASLAHCEHSGSGGRISLLSKLL